MDDAAWNDYADGTGRKSLFHRHEWERAFGFYGLPCERLAAVRQGRMVGILPLVWQRSIVFGNHLVSLPWFDAAGVLGDDAEAREALIDEARNVARQRGARSLQLRQTEPLDPSLPVRTDKVLMRLELEPDPDSLWKRFSPKVRNQVRKAEKSGLAVERGGAELLVPFYEVYSENMRDLGSPPHHREFFRAVFEAFADRTRIYVVRLEGRAIGAGWTMAGGDCLEIPWASSLRRYNHLCVNHSMYWAIISDACRRRFGRFHFGRSTRDSGTYHFKKQWGAEPVQLYWHTLRTDGRTVGPPKSAQESYGWATRAWSRLPLRVARWLGPKIIAKVP